MCLYIWCVWVYLRLCESVCLRVCLLICVCMCVYEYINLFVCVCFHAAPGQAVEPS